MHKYVNPLYDGFTSTKLHENACKDILLPDCHQSSMQIWSEYYFRQMKSRMKRINYDGVSSLSASVNIKMEDKIKRIMEKADIVSAKNGRLRRENDKLRRDSRKMQMLIRKLSEQNSRINNTSSSSIYDDIDGYVSVRGEGNQHHHYQVV